MERISDLLKIIGSCTIKAQTNQSNLKLIVDFFFIQPFNWVIYKAISSIHSLLQDNSPHAVCFIRKDKSTFLSSKNI